MAIPRADYPRPQFVRPAWQCLNGTWEFELDQGDSGLERGLCERPLRDRITVPFCPESTLSGIGHTDFIHAVWYRRTVDLPAAWAGQTVLLHLGAVDYDATVWVNGVEVGRHRGGWCGFTCDLSTAARPGECATIVVRARDQRWVPGKPAGKQSNFRYDNAGCHYTRTTGIWQTVWLEPVPAVALQRPRLTPDLASGCLHLTQPLSGDRRGHQVRATLGDAQGVVATATVAADEDLAPQLTLPIPAPRRRWWCPADPHLYTLDLALLDPAGQVVDRATSYAGMRSITLAGPEVRLNGQSIFQRLVLDQGLYPDGLLTAPSDEALVRDITLAQAAGFNGARLHQKVFEERFLYHADRLGYLCWGEFGDWGMDRDQPQATYLTQWLEVVQRDYNHPAIIGWCPLNETAQPIPDHIPGLDDLTLGCFLAARAMDPTRPIIDSSGYAHRVAATDIYDCHDYDQNPATMRARHAGLAAGQPFINGHPEPDAPAHQRPWSIPYRGQPYFLSEFGGAWWDATAAQADGQAPGSWGYGERPRTLEEFYARFAGLCDVLLDHPHMFGYCYTQLTDVFQERNGIFAFDRSPKFDLARLHAIQQRPAAIERGAGAPAS